MRYRRRPTCGTWRVAALALWLMVWMPSAMAQDSRELAALSEALESLTGTVGPAVVQVFATAYAAGQGVLPPGAALLSQQRGSGSGVIVDPSGYIVTNGHIVADAVRVQVELALPDEVTAGRRSIVAPTRRLVGAQVVGIDAETDLAVLKVQPGRPLPFLELGDSDELKPGQLVMAFGSPRRLENSVSLGVVSAVARQIRPDHPMIYIQTDAAINPGNSGGPLVDVKGQIVGISTFIISQSGGSEGIGFAAPSNIVRTVYQQILEHGRVVRGEIGVRAQTITRELADGLGLAQDWGVVLADVHPLGPADLAGLRVGDIVLSLDGKVMENARQLQVNLYPRGVGDTVKLEVVRGDQRLALSVTPVPRPGDPDRFQQMLRPREHLVPILGVLGLNLTPEVIRLLPPLRRDEGILVAASSASSVPARGEPLLPGDVIYAVNARPVASLDDLRNTLAGLGPGAAAVLQVERAGELTYLTFMLD